MEIIHQVKVINRLGLHLRAAAQMVKVSSRFKCRILVKHPGGQVDGKSLLNLMTLAAGCGRELTLVFQGEDAQDAKQALHELFLNKFGERE
jgi:phosphotransferase system HPr (HPr) family protein